MYTCYIELNVVSLRSLLYIIHLIEFKLCMMNRYKHATTDFMIILQKFNFQIF